MKKNNNEDVTLEKVENNKYVKVFSLENTLLIISVFIVIICCLFIII